MVPASSHEIPRVSWYSGSCQLFPPFVYRALTFSGRLFQNRSTGISLDYAVLTPECTHSGLGSSDFARRYFRNHCCFLFLRLLRCFSSAGSLRKTMDSSYGTWSLSMWVSPFGDLRIDVYVPLPAAFRSLSRPSSAPSARASTLRSFCLTASFITGSVP